MTTKPKREVVLQIAQRPGESQGAAIARMSTKPEVQAAITLKSLEDFDRENSAPLMDFVAALEKHGKAANSGDLTQGEAMLMAHAHTLDSLFNTLTRRALLNLGQYPDAVERYLRLALKAQSQCRSTLETLAAIKNPPHVAFVKQANIAAGHQQVNNGTPAREIESSQSKLLESVNGERLDFGTTQAAGRADPQLATVATIHRAANGRG